jgi:hypothetical protein
MPQQRFPRPASVDASPPAPAGTRTGACSQSLVGLWLVASEFWLFRAGYILLRLKSQGSRIPIIFILSSSSTYNHNQQKNFALL